MESEGVLLGAFEKEGTKDGFDETVGIKEAVGKPEG